MATVSNEVDEIRHQMATIRRELHEDVQEVVASAEAVTDWRRYLRMHPWAALGVAFAAGYIIVPKRRRSIPRNIATQADVARIREVVEESGEQAKAKTKEKSLLSTLFGMVAPVIVRVGQGYAAQSLESWLARQMQRQMATGPHPIPSQAPGGPDRPGGAGGV